MIPTYNYILLRRSLDEMNHFGQIEYEKLERHYLVRYIFLWVFFSQFFWLFQTLFLPPFVVAFLDFVKFEVVFDETAAYDEVDGCGDKEKFVKPLANWGLFSCFDEFSCPFFATEIASKASENSWCSFQTLFQIINKSDNDSYI